MGQAGKGLNRRALKLFYHEIMPSASTASRATHWQYARMVSPGVCWARAHSGFEIFIEINSWLLISREIIKPEGRDLAKKIIFYHCV